MFVKLYFLLLELVLIESDWNLKITVNRSMLKNAFVLIESDWNLKMSTETTQTGVSTRY